MNRHDITTLCLRLAAIYAWFNAFEFLAGGAISFFITAASMRSPISPVAILGYISPVLVYAGIGTFLFLKAPSLTQYLLPQGDSSEAAPKVSNPAILAFAVVGLVGAIFSLPRLVQLIFSLLQSDQFRPQTAKNEFLRELPPIAAAMIQFALCFALVVYARPFATWWERRQIQKP